MAIVVQQIPYRDHSQQIKSLGPLTAHQTNGHTPSANTSDTQTQPKMTSGQSRNTLNPITCPTLIEITSHLMKTIEHLMSIRSLLEKESSDLAERIEYLQSLQLRDKEKEGFTAHCLKKHQEFRNDLSSSVKAIEALTQIIEKVSGIVKNMTEASTIAETDKYAFAEQAKILNKGKTEIGDILKRALPNNLWLAKHSEQLITALKINNKIIDDIKRAIDRG